MYADMERVMVTKRVSPVTKTMKARTAASSAPELTDSAVIEVLKSTPTRTALSASIDPSVRRQLIAAEAYFLAERRGFAAGNEVEDWVTAEEVVDTRLRQMEVA